MRVKLNWICMVKNARIKRFIKMFIGLM